MNIVYCDECPTRSAEAQPYKMLVKMPLETVQMVCTAHRELDGDEDADANGLDKRAYWKHPCTIWARESSSNYSWLYKHFLALGLEYEYRYGRKHASVIKLEEPLSKMPDNITHTSLTPLAQAMPEEYKNEDAIVAYRDYCINEKHYAKWERNRTKPIWWTVQEAV